MNLFVKSNYAPRILTYRVAINTPSIASATSSGWIKVVASIPAPPVGGTTDWMGASMTVGICFVDKTASYDIFNDWDINTGDGATSTYCMGFLSGKMG